MVIKVNSKVAAPRPEVVLASSARHRHGATTYEASFVYSVPEELAEELLGLEYGGEPFFITPTKKHAGYPRKALGLEVLAQTEDVTKDDGGAITTMQEPADNRGDLSRGDLDTGDGIQIT